jgi:outer membrane protein with beta-barrel domain
MRVTTYVIAATLVGGLSEQVMAQTPPPPPASTAATSVGTVQSHWTAAGFVGSNFGLSTSDPSIDFGGQLGYLWRGVVGPEFLADFTPTFKINNGFLAENPNVNSYMANVMAAVPLGAEGQFQPYVSGGFGAIQLGSTVFNAFGLAGPVSPDEIAASGTTTETRSKLGSNIGGGLMGFAGNVGFRADVRYYRASTNESLSSTPAGQLSESLLSGLRYWRANAGLAIRW